MCFLDNETIEHIVRNYLLIKKSPKGKLSRKQNAIIFGSGDIAKRIFSLYGKYLNFTHCFDNYSTSGFNGLSTHVPFYDEDFYRDSIIIIASSSYYSISKQLKSLGYNKLQHHINGEFFCSPIYPYVLKIKSLDFNAIKSKFDSHGIEYSYKIDNDNNISIFLEKYSFQLIDSIFCAYSSSSGDAIIYIHLANNEKKSIFSPIINNGFFSNSAKELLGKATTIFFQNNYRFSLDTFIDERKIIEDTSIDNHKDEWISKSIQSLSLPLDYLRRCERQFYYFGYMTKIFRSLLTCSLNVDSELIVIVIRESALEYNLVNDIKRFFIGEGLNFLHYHVLSNVEKSQFERHVRGGDWGLAANDFFSGGPASIMIFKDNNPSRPEYWNDENHPSFYRKNIIYDKKNHLRELLRSSLGSDKTINFIHTPDDLCESIEYYHLCSNSLGFLSV